MSLVSIITPYFKKKDYINEAVNSVLSQTYKNFELIIIYDDEDRSEVSLISNIQKLDKRIKLIINKRNYGAGISRNIGINASKGEYIAFLDADDIWKNSKLQKQIAFMKKNNFSATHTSYEIINSKNNDKNTSKRIAKKINFKILLKSCDIGLSTVILKKELFKNNVKFPKIQTKEDYVLWLLITRNGHIFYPLKNILTKWRVSINSLSSSTFIKLINGYIVYKKYMRFSSIKSLLLLLQLSFFYLWKNLKF